LPALLFELAGLHSSFFSPIGFSWCSHTSYCIILYFSLPSSVNSNLVHHFVSVTTGLHKQSGAISMIPIPSFSSSIFEAISTISQELTMARLQALNADESSRLFIAPELDSSEARALEVSSRHAIEKWEAINELLANALGFDTLTKMFFKKERTLVLDPLYIPSKEDCLSYSMGCIFGRWDVRIAINNEIAPKLQGVFDPLPSCPPGTLVGPDGLPASSGHIVSEEWLRARPDASNLPEEGKVKQPVIPDAEYPITINWEGILVDDPDHQDDIVRRVQEVIKVIWHEKAESIEQEVCQILGIKELREYFRRPGNGGFWLDHVKRYSKSRRKAPIYWLLQSAKKNYALWLYYHRLDSDMLFKALTKYVEPKIRLEESRLEQLRTQKAGAGNAGREARQLQQQIERQEALVGELNDFRDKLRKVADLHLEPDLNDGVVLNIAPLWELVPWDEAKKYWEELLAGKYEWSSISKQLRKKEVIK
jgi:hypothetical protein